MSGIEPKLPLSYSYSDSYYNSIKTLKETVKQNLKNLFYTAKGEKKRDSNFGINIKSFLFENFTQETRQDITTTIMEQVGKYMPFIKVLKIDINFIEDFGELYIKFEYFIKNLGEQDILNVQVKAGK